jgi:dihydroorotate dehydrogenase electron transfer subunit
MPVAVDADVLSNTPVSADYCVLALRAPELAATIEPGQFVMVRTAPGDTPLLRRPYSFFDLIRDAEGRPVGFSILNKRVGVGSGLLFEARAGDRVNCLGPLGRAFTRSAPPTEAWMVAGGVGLAPFAILTEQLAAAGVPLTLFYGARSSNELLCLDRFEPHGVQLVLTTEDGSRGLTGRVTLPLEEALRSTPPDRAIRIYACGPEPMLEAVGRLAQAHGRPCELSMERLMGCGMGGCYSCVVRVRTPDGRTRYARSCVEGPALAAEDIVWDGQ